MADSRQYPGRYTRAGALVKWVAIIAFIPLVFFAGVYFSDRILSPPADPEFEKALRDPKKAPLSLTNSIGLPLRQTAPESGIWIASTFISAAQFESLTGISPSLPEPPVSGSKDPAPTANRPVGNLTHSAAATFCKILTDSEHASGILPKSFSYRLPSSAEIPSSNQGSDEWLHSEATEPVVLHTATAIIDVETPLYAPDADLAPGGWIQWHTNLVAGPAGALHLPKEAAPLLEITGSPDGTRRRLSIHASAPDPATAAELANGAATVIRNECNSLAKERLESDFSYFRAEVDSANARNENERAALLDLMAEYDITDTLDLPSWFLGHEELHDDLGVQNAKNNVERLGKFRKFLEDHEEDALPDLSSNPELSEAAATYRRIYAERKLLQVEEQQKIKGGLADTDPNLVATRAKIASRTEALLISGKTLIEDVDRELKVAENLLMDLKLAKIRRDKIGPPVVPTSDQPPEESKLEANIADITEKREQFTTLKGDTLYDYALIHSETENPLRSLIPEYMKHSSLAKEIRKAISQLETDADALEKSPLNPEPPKEPTPEITEPETPTDVETPPEPEAEELNEEEKQARVEAEAKAKVEAAAKAEAERVAAERKAAERLKNLTEQRLADLKEFAVTIDQKKEQLNSAESDKAVAEEAVNKEIETLLVALKKSQEHDRKELEFLAAKRKYLVGWHRIKDLKAELEVKEDALRSPIQAASIVSEATAESAVKNGELHPVSFIRGSRILTASPKYRSPHLHFRVVLEPIP